MAQTPTILIDGVAVVETLPVESPLRDGQGKPVYFTRIDRYRMATGPDVYGCKEDGCDFTAAAAGAVRIHLSRAHRPEGRLNMTHAMESLTIGQLLRRIRNHETVVAERDEWRQRAQKAEKELAAIRGALGNVGKLL